MAIKYLDEFRHPQGVKHYQQKITASATRAWRIMEICGGQTHSILKHNLPELLPANLELLHGPGCPVCVTPEQKIDQAIYIASQAKVIFCSYGDMLRVRGSQTSLLDCKGKGADVRIVLSAMDAVQLAQQNPSREVVFFAIGFETTAPGNALAIQTAQRLGLKNFSVLVSQVTVPAAMDYLLASPQHGIDGFLAAGHVCTVMGYGEYYEIATQHHTPIVVTGFEPVDIMKGLYHCLLQLESGESQVENCYPRCVNETGNLHAQNLLREVFTIIDMEWRGIGVIKASGLGLSAKYQNLDANYRYGKPENSSTQKVDCISGLVLQGREPPCNCPHFGKNCTPDHPLGATMVSEEGACAAYYRYREIYD